MLPSAAALAACSALALLRITAHSAAPSSTAAASNASRTRCFVFMAVSLSAAAQQHHHCAHGQHSRRKDEDEHQPQRGGGVVRDGDGRGLQRLGLHEGGPLLPGQRGCAALGDYELLREMMPDVSKYRPAVKFWLLLGAYAILVVMLARPQMGSKISREKRNGIEAIICVDISNSMLAQDVVPSRLDKSKMLVENLIDNFTNDKIGLVVFAGDAFVQLPITSDYVSAKMFLSNIDPSLIATQGTDIARAVDIATKSFTKQENVGRAIIIITDGEDHEGGAKEAAAEARKRGINVFVLGVGDPKGSPIPMANGGYMTDSRGETVMSALNTQMCREIAAAGSGTYIHVDNTSDAQESLNESLAKLQRGETESVIYSEFDEQFQAFGILAILLLIAEICVLEIRNPMLRRIRLFKRK